MKHLSSLLRGGFSAALLILLCLAGPAARAQVPAWQMAIAVAGGTSAVQAMTTDANGNVYVAGNFSATVSFGNISLTSAGGNDLFVAKWSSGGGFVWAQRAGGTADDYATALAVSGTAVYVAGQFQSPTAGFGSTSLANAGPASTDDLFVAKLTDAGSFVWAQRAGSTGIDAANALSVQGANVYVAGTFSSAAIGFGAATLTNASSGGSYDAFVAKLVDGGTSTNFAWAQRAGGTDSDYAATLAINGTSVYIAGDFRGATASFGAITLLNTNATLPVSDDVFVAKLVDLGTSAAFVWVQQAGGIGYDDAYALTTNGPNLYLTGTFGYAPTGATAVTAAFGSTTLTALGLSDVFITKLTDVGNTGSFVWARQAGSTSYDTPKGISVVGTNVYVAGSFGGSTASFGNVVLTATYPTSYSEVFVAKLIDAGAGASFAWAQQAGSPSHGEANAVVLSGSSVYVAGGVASTATFGPFSVANPTGNQFAYLASLTDPTLLATTPALAGSAFALYPNPARAATTVALPALPGTASATLTLRDALGRAVRAEVVPLPPAGLRHELDLTHLPAGLYALQVQAGAATATRRLVVE